MRSDEEIIVSAQARISDPAVFLKGSVAAVDIDGNEVAPHSDMAVKWSLAGSLLAELYLERMDPLPKARRLRRLLDKMI